MAINKPKILFLIASLLISLSLFSQIHFDNPDSVINYLEGDWQWLGSCGGFMGTDCSFPNNETSKKYVFNKIENINDSINYTFYQSDTIVKTGNTKISYSNSILGDQWNLEDIYGFTTQKLTIYFNDYDTITLVDNCYDCYSHGFERKSTITSSNLILLKKKLMIYPNPCNTLLYLKFENKVQVKLVSILNIEGKIVEQKKGDIREIKVSHLPQGQYFVKIKILNETILKKIIIE